MANTQHATTQHYYVPSSTIWPFIGSVGLALLVLGIIRMLNQQGGTILLFMGIATLIYMLYGWFGEVIRESESRTYTRWEDRSFRIGMSWFIFSEVMFFAAFFGALFYARHLSVPWLGGAGEEANTHEWLWNSFSAVWPTNGPANVGGSFEAMPAWGLPTLNTIILLTSGVTVTWAHHSLKIGNRQNLIYGLAMTVALGFLFVGLQMIEYSHAYHEMNLTLKSGIYGSTFYLLTGFHGMHVTLGAIMLTVILVRSMKGHFTASNHFGFEAAAWYWHFVDVVWLILFVFVYWL
ncbi:cytochrome c oxidase subunit 3 [Thiolinea disciformis]|uniref:cytochrome c oxidase subunit 3 n=1 Tax=Thiolinea disciformis TaxID=125614 RepID=UPI00037AA7E8|nr:cytochrome c oxidase subunit 3 [Thiolinea disciformis]